MANNELVRFEQQIGALEQSWESLLAGIMPVARFKQTVMVITEKNVALLDCDRQSLFNTITSAAVLQLPMDGVTGQAWPIPFKKKVQLVIGYKGYNTLGARAGMTITGDVVREGDEFDYAKGTGAFVRHKPKLSNTGRIIAAWAAAESHDRPSAIEVLGIDDLLAVKERSPGAKMSESPWRDTVIGFPAMCAKTVKRRLARVIPMFEQTQRYHLAARMEEAHDEQGALSHIRRDNVVVADGRALAESPLPSREPNETPQMEELMGPKPDAAETALRHAGTAVAREGMAALVRWFNALSDREKRIVGPLFDGELKARAREVDSQ